MVWANENKRYIVTIVLIVGCLTVVDTALCDTWVRFTGTAVATPGDGPRLCNYADSYAYTGIVWNGCGTPSSGTCHSESTFFFDSTAGVTLELGGYLLSLFQCINDNNGDHRIYTDGELLIKQDGATVLALKNSRISMDVDYLAETISGSGWATLDMDAGDESLRNEFNPHGTEQVEIVFNAWNPIIQDICGEYGFDATFRPTQYKENIISRSVSNIGVLDFPDANVSLNVAQFTLGGQNNDMNAFTASQIMTDPCGAPPAGIEIINPYCYWELGTVLSSITADVTYDLAGMQGIQNLSKLRILSRENANDSWRIYGDQEVVDVSHIRANGVTSFSEWAIGSTMPSWPEQDKLLALDGTEDDEFGHSVSNSGEYAIVGARWDGPGSAYIFKRDDESWSQHAKLTAADGGEFGYSVFISDDYAIVGAPYADGNEPECGSAYIFCRLGKHWIQLAKLTASDGKYLDRFGGSVCISSDYAIVGAWTADDSTGSAYIFKMPDSGWVDANETDKLTASDGETDDNFGCSVSICGDYCIVGAWADDADGYNSGSAYIFTPNSVDPNNWDQQVKLTPSDGAAEDHFGYSVSISADYCIVGAYLDNDNGDNSGSAYIFAPNNVDANNWEQQAKLLASDGAAGDGFGISVSISGDYAVVGAPWDDDNGGESGSAYIFTPNNIDPNNWVQKAKLTASDAYEGDYFGYFVGNNGDQAIVGAHYDDDNGFNSGSAYVFERICPISDLTGDCRVDFEDFSIMAGEWLQGN